jgi:aspartate kinase
VSVTVIKIGGSVLTGPDAFRRAASFVTGRLSEHPGTKFVVVVSAEQGLTDAQLAAAREIVDAPDSRTLDLLWSTGELRSVALLTLALHACGVRATGVNVHQTGLVEHETRDCEQPDVRPLRLQALLATYDVIVAPGFLARGAGDAIVSLGRGGSDLTAVMLALALRADRCELVKDVPGYFSTDPNVDPHARHLASVDYERAHRMASAGCELVQTRALEVARDHELPLVVRSMTGQVATLVHNQSARS